MARPSKRQYRDLCRRLRNQIRARSLASEEEIAGVYPGSDATWNELVHAYAMLHRMCEREKFLRHGSDYATQKLLAALRDDPLEVQLFTEAEDDGEPLVVEVHPKSEATLRWLEGQFWWINWLTVRHETMREIADQFEARQAEGEQPFAQIEDPISAMEAIVAEQTRLTALIVWVVTTPGPSMPWPHLKEPPPADEIPERWMDLHPLDVQRIESAIFEVNIGRLQLLPKPKERGKGVSPDVFFARRAKQTNRSVRELMMSESLAHQIAGVVLAGSDVLE